MAPSTTDSIILKVLSGIQSGAEVTLLGGEYIVGSGPDDDIQLMDISLRPSHLRVRLSGAKIEIAGVAGSVKTNAGLVVGANSDWQAIEPLDIVTAGTTRFAMGAPTAQWTTIADNDDDDAEGRQAKARGKRRTSGGNRRSEGASGSFSLSRIALPLIALVGVVALALWFGLLGSSERVWGQRQAVRDDLLTTQNALAGLSFASRVEVRQDVDGAIFVTGYVENPAERRAILSAVEATAVPARVRVWVLQTLREEVDNLIRAERANATATLSGNGVVTLEGLILNEAVERRLTGLIRDQVLGIASVDSRIRTARTLLADVERLGRMSQITPLVLFRLDGEIIEANGAIPVEKVDSWVGFLQAYSQRFAQDIPLRSFVQLQNVTLQAGAQAGPVQAISIGPARPGSNDTALDLERLRRGSYNLNDVFAGLRPEAAAQAAATEAAPRNSQPAAPPAAGLINTFLQQVRAASSTNPAIAVEPAAAGSAPGAPAGAGSAAANPAAGATAPGTGPVALPATQETRALQEAARRLVEQWRDGRFDATGSGGPLKGAMDALAGAITRGDAQAADLTQAERLDVASRLLPLFADPRRGSGSPNQCWPGGRLNHANLGTALFWLDLASVTETVTIRGLGTDLQDLALEAALNPERTGQCVRALTLARPDIQLPSVYLSEVTRNPGFVRFITRDMPSFALDVSGVSLGSNRFIQTRSGQKMQEGAAPDAGSRIALVGELGAAIQLRDGLAAVVFGPEVNWSAIQ